MEDEILLYLYGATDKGKVRPVNQDAYVLERVDCDSGYAVVCDGMGGEGGSWASQQAVEIMGKALQRGLQSGIPFTSLQYVMESAISAANAVIYSKSCAYAPWKGMGTTALLVAVMQDQVCYAHVGDSRLYLLDKTAPFLQQMTKDHSIVQQWVDMGVLTRQEADAHPKRNMITRAVGVKENVEAQYGEFSFMEGRLLLCTDGLYETLNLERHLDLITTCAGDQDVYLLIDEANKKGGSDNITAVILSK